MNNKLILTKSQAADMLSISENTLNALVYSGQIPHLLMPGSAGGTPQLYFISDALLNWCNIGPMINTNNRNQVVRLKQRLQKKYPEVISQLKNYDKQFITPRKPKGYNLTKVANKKMGFIYYVRYIEKGKLVPTRWSTHTNNFEAAKQFAVDNKTRLLDEYYHKKKLNKNNGIYKIMRQYYEKDSVYQKNDARRGRILGEDTRKQYHGAIINHWIPFLRKRRITTLDEINIPLMVLFQDYCMDKGMKPQSVNYAISFINHIFDYLVLRGHIETNPCKGLIPLSVQEEENKIRGCYNITEMKGIFNKRWSDNISFLLCLVIYSTGMRNSEIDRIKVKDIIRINQCWFINIPKSKSKYGARMVPLHDFVRGKLVRYINQHKKGPEDLLFCQKKGKIIPRFWYKDATVALGRYTGYDKSRLKKENITFYSGRHFWKTMVNAGDLGDIEEYFMGHKISNDVAKRYNHRDKQGQEKIVQKAKAVFRILDNRLFITRR